jgi:hypothetical protein
MASPRTALTELATAVGMFWDPAGAWPASVESVEVPGIDRSVWHAALAPALRTSTDHREVLTALRNGQRFREVVLGGRRPERVRWTGRDKSVWSSEIPRDLVVDDVWFIQAKHDSSCVLNTSPHSVFELLTAESDVHHSASWYATVAPRELQAYYDAVRQAAAPGALPIAEADLGAADRVLLKQLLPKRTFLSDEDEARYHELCAAVSTRTADRWQARLGRATPMQRARLFVRILRIAGGPYWLLGAKAGHPLRLRVCDTQEWRTRFKLKSFTADPAEAGQPQVDWQAEVVDRTSGATVPVEGFCEIRWSHGKLQGSPECKVQVTTPLGQLPGYDPID